MQIYFHSRLCSYLPRVPILEEGTVYNILFESKPNIGIYIIFFFIMFKFKTYINNLYTNIKTCIVL